MNIKIKFELEETELKGKIENLIPTTSGGSQDAVLYTAQTLTDEQKTQARANIGAGTSDFSGSYNDLIGSPEIPKSLSELSEDSNHRTVSDAEKEAWNKKSNFSGNYDDLNNKPVIPEQYVLPAATAETLGGVKIGDGINIAEDGTISTEGSGGGSFVVNFNYDESTDTYSADKTFDEIQDAIQKGYYVCGIYDETFFNLNTYSETYNDLEFRNLYVEEDSLLGNPTVQRSFYINSSNDIEPYEAQNKINTTTPKISNFSGNVFSVALKPNSFYVFPTAYSLSVTLAAPSDTSVVNEYKFRFTSGATATTLTLPSGVIGDITIEANKVYEISIIDNYLVYQSWAVSA